MKIIGLSGYAQSGKNTVAALIAEQVEGSVETVAFADLIKVSAARALGVLRHPDDVGLRAVRRWADDFKLSQNVQITDAAGQVVHEISGRSFLQRYGSEAHRDLFGPDFWVDQITWERDCDVLIFTDCRFANEAEAIRARSGEVWRIVRPRARSGEHVSEKALPGELVDMEILNAGTLQDLARTVGRATAELVGTR